MRTRDIKQWLRAADVADTESPYDSDDEMAPGHDAPDAPARAPDSAADWDAFVTYAAEVLRSTKPRRRDLFLNECLPQIIYDTETTSAERVELYQLLFQAYEYHPDRATRLKLLGTGDALLQADIGSDGKPFDSMLCISALKSLRAEAERFCGPNGAVRGPRAQLAGVHHWLCTLLNRVLSAREGLDGASWTSLVQTVAMVYDALAGSSRPRDRLLLPAQHAAWRAVRGHADRIPLLLDTLLATPAGAHTFRAVTALGMVLDVALHLRPKKGEESAGLAYVAEYKVRVLQYYATHIVSSKTPVPTHVLTALHGFLGQVTQAECDEYVFPTLDKMMLRSPEIASVVATHLCRDARVDRGAVLCRVQQPLLSALASANAGTRRNALALCEELVRDGIPDAFLEALQKSLKAGESRSEDQRLALYEFLGAIPAAPYSARLVEAVAPLLQKEVQPALLRTAFLALWHHAGSLIGNDTPLPPAALKALAAKVQQPKAPLRAAAMRSVLALPLDGAGAQAFAKDLVPLAETGIANGAAALTAPESALEASAAASVLARLALGTDGAAGEKALAPLLAPSPKLPFLLNEKVVRKLRDADASWPSVHADALLHTLQWRGLACLHDAALQTAVVAVLAEYVCDSFKVVPRLLRAIAAYDRRLALHIVTRLVRTMLAGEHVSSTRLRTLLQVPIEVADDGSTPAAPEADRATTALLAELVVLAHLAELQDAEHEFFVHLCRTAQTDPHEAVAAQKTHILEVIADAQHDAQLARAADAALSTVAFIAPEILSMACERIVRDASLHRLDAFTEQDMAIWAAPGDVPYIDVLASEQKDTKAAKGSMEKWDAEVRASLAKKQGAPTLSKQQQAAVDAQLEKEKGIRSDVDRAAAHLQKAVRSARAVARSRSTALDAYVSTLLRAMLAVLASPRARTLGLGMEAASALEALAQSGETRAQTMAAFVLSTWLRRADPGLAPLDYLLEPVADVELRVLYQLRLTVDGAPLSLASASFFAPWLVSLIEAGRLCGDEDKDDQVVERMQLALECLAAHSGLGAEPAFPRSDVLRALLLLLRHFPMLAHETISALRAYGEAIARTTIGAGALAQQLLDAALADERRERDGALQCLVPLDLTELEFSAPLYLAMHAEDEEIARTADRIWAENAMDVPTTYVTTLVALLEHKHAYVQATTPRALGSACALHPDTFASLREGLEMLYKAKNYSLEPEYDQFGMVIDATLHREDPWTVRLGVAESLAEIAPLFTGKDVLPFFAFALRSPGALGDRNEAVRRATLRAATAIVDAHGAEVLTPLIAELEASLDSADDAVTEAAVVLLGRAANHLDEGDAHVRRVVDRLLDALHTPSELVQEAVGACLAPLVRTKAVAGDVSAMVDGLFTTLLHGEKYAGRRGAAYGLAGVVQGRGIGSVKALRILPRLSDAVHDTSAPTLRQGAMFAYEVLAKTLRILFEPYVPEILPHILLCFGDNNGDVREATQDTARVLMQSLSGQCVKQILPSLLEGLDEKQWRTKRGAIELLGAMAYCAPRQLSASLPIVIPRLSEVLTDSHTQVRNAANKSLKQFGEVIHNPEIHDLVPTLLKALVDPNTKTGSALKALLGTKFVHYIDAPSLALIAPIIERGLRERTVAAQKHAAQIVGNLASLTDTRDFVPYLGRYTPLVREVLVSPVPDARSVAAKALGTLVERLGEVHFVDLIPALLGVLQTNATGVDRHGAAQGLAEVLAGLGMERMESLLPSIIANTSARQAYVREGHLALLIYLPATFGNRFVPHLPVIVPPIIASIADEDESVREASMRAGRMLIGNYLQRSVDLLLPQLEPRLFDELWRVRLAALQLTADLLFRLSGVSGKAEADEDENEEAEVANHSIQKALQAALGQDRRARLLAAIYVLRQDPNIPVRQAAAHTWKALVQNTPRTAREVLPIMLDLIIGALAAEGDEQREMAGRTLGELVRKLGEKILQETIPLLATRAAQSPQAATRAGVCAAVADILANATKTQLEDHEEAIIAIVRGALVDSAPQVRAAAARTFDAVQAHLGSRAIDTTVPTLLSALQQGDARADTALAALREIVRTRPEVVFPVLVPALAQVPLSAKSAHALAALVPVAGSALAPNVDAMLSCVARTLLDGGVRSGAEPSIDVAPLHALADAVFAALAEIEALHQAIVLLLSWMSSREGPARRALACDLFVRFCRAKNPSLNWDDYTVDCVRKLVALLEEDHAEVDQAAHAALIACVDAVPKNNWSALVLPLRRALASSGAPDAPLPGLCIPRGPQPFTTLLLHGLMHGSAEQRENGALGLGEVVEKSTPDAVKPFVTGMVGPLIRLCGDRHTPPVKTAILVALDTMVRRVPQLVRPFYPQLQRSFQKAVGDQSSNTVRSKAGAALGVLMGHQMRVDQVLLELVQGIKASIDGELPPPSAPGVDPVDVGDAMALALAQVLAHVPADKVGEASRAAIDDVLTAAFLAEEEVSEPLKKALAELSAAWLAFDTPRAGSLLERHVLQPAPVDVQLAALCLRACVDQASDALYGYCRPPALVPELATTWMGDAPSVARPARETRDLLKKVEPWRSDEEVQNAL